MSGAKAEMPEDQLKIPKELPVLALRDIVVYPFIIVPLSVSRDRSIKAVDRALSDNRMILLVAQKDSQVEEPGEEDVFGIGTVGVIMRMLKLPDGRIRVLVQGVCRARIEGFTRQAPYLQAKIARVADTPGEATLEQEALLRSVKKSLERSVSLGKAISSEVMVIASNLEDPGRLADLVASNLDLKIDDAQAILKLADPVARLKRVHELLNKELDLLAMQ
ncbi:MAG TPA: LON peptidase substrate-binding domain-containing protein, partial [Candidatus Polarisedimenticolia bacterium]|nr:LON peptidase substrate-binding domain-containing protein [Candidatus Polarisedimenticolia bacterium]